MIGINSTLRPILSSSLDVVKTPQHSSISISDGAAVFLPGSIMLFETQLEGIPIDLSERLSDTKKAGEAWEGLGIVDLNVMLFRSDGEERDAGQLIRSLPVVVSTADFF